MSIFVHEWRGFIRNHIVRSISLFFVVSLIFVSWLGIVQSNAQVEAQQHAHKHIRAQWDEMEPSNPHHAAHFGSYAFKPISVLNSIDEGIGSVTGNVLRLEGHTQNEIVYSEASQSLLISKFGKLTPSLLFQFLIPLFLIALSFTAYTSERETSRLRLLVIQGATIPNLLFAKVLSIWSLGCILLFFMTSTQLFFNMHNVTFDILFRLSLLILSYALYYFILISLTVTFSIWFKRATAAMSLILVIWISWTIFLPKVIGSAAEQLIPLPTRVEFQNSMTEDREQGIDGHNPSDERRKTLESEILKKYNVQTVKELPINFAGIVMQADEEYGNEVWDKHFGNLYRQLVQQKNIVQYSGILNPFSAVQSLSMGSAGTDMFHHLDFLRQAEDYRRVFIKTLNDEYAFGGSKTGERGWKADTEFFQSVKDFTYIQPTIVYLSRNYILDIMMLVFWLLLSFLSLHISSRKASVL